MRNATYTAAALAGTLLLVGCVSSQAGHARARRAATSVAFLIGTSRTGPYRAVRDQL